MAKGVLTSKFLKRGATTANAANKVSKFKRSTSLLPRGKRIRVKKGDTKGIVNVKGKKLLKDSPDKIRPITKDTKIPTGTKISKVVKNIANNILPSLKQEVREDTEKVTDPNSLFNSIFSGGLGELDRFGSALDKMSKNQLPFLERASKLAVSFVDALASGKSGGGFMRTVGNILKVVGAIGVAALAAPFVGPVLGAVATVGAITGGVVLATKGISDFIRGKGLFKGRKEKEKKKKEDKLFAKSLDKLEGIMTLLEKRQEPKEPVRPPEGEAKKETTAKSLETPMGGDVENATIEITDDGKFIVTRKPTTVEEDITEEQKPKGLLRAITGVADTFTGGIFDFDKRGDTKFQDMGQGITDQLTMGTTDFDGEGRSPVQNVIQNIFGLVRKGLKGDKGEKGSVGLGGDRGLTGKDIVSRVMGIKDQATEFTLNLPATKFAKKLLDTGVNAILGGPVMGEEIRSMDDMQQLQLNVPSEVTTSKVEQDLSQLNERQSVATDVAKNVKKTNGGQPMVLPLVTGGGDLVGRETKANKNVLQMNQSGQQIPILAAVDPNNMHIPSTYAVLNIIDANNGL